MWNNLTAETRVKIQLTLQGLINQFGFFLLLSSSESIAIGFNEKNLVSLLMFSANIASVTILFLNALYFMKYEPKHRLIANAIIMTVGYIVITIGCFVDFYIVILGALFTGTASAFGQVIHYGFIKRLPSEYVGPFSSGTGVWGLVGSFTYMVLNACEVPDFVIFMWMVANHSFYLTIDTCYCTLRTQFFKHT